MTDVDGRQLLDLSMGFGAMLAGHLNPVVVEEVQSAAAPRECSLSPLHLPLPMLQSESVSALESIRFASPTQVLNQRCTQFALLVLPPREMGILKVEGGYHGSYDPFVVSAKPPLNKAGKADKPTPYIEPNLVPGDIYVVPYNNIPALEKMFKKNAKKIACFIVEPVLENLAIILPDSGYLERVRELCDQYNVVLIFDEVKTGLTAGAHGACCSS